MSAIPHELPKLPTGIEGLDQLTKGGVPAGRTTLLTGATGTGKTLFGVQYLAKGIERYGEPGVFVTFEERPDDIARNTLSLGMDVAAWVDAGSWAFVDASPDIKEEIELVGSIDLSGLLARLSHAVTSIGAQRVVLDSLSGVFDRYGEISEVRREVVRVVEALRDLGVTALITAERRSEGAFDRRSEAEELATDCVLVLRNTIDQDKRRRTIEVLKMRGAAHHSGRWLFTIDRTDGLVVLPHSFIAQHPEATTERSSTGLAELDAMCGGGLFRDAVAFLSGPTGTGKTLLATHFAAAAAEAGERCLLYSFEESREQLVRNAAAAGFDLEALEAAGHLALRCEYPELASLEDLLLSIKRGVEELNPSRLVIDNLSALERVTSLRGIRDIIMGLASYVKQRSVTTVFTAATGGLLGGSSASEVHLSSLTDVIILLRYVEVRGVVRRAMTVLKVRGSAHDHSIREFTIDDDGVHIDGPVKGWGGGFLGTMFDERAVPGPIAGPTAPEGGNPP